MYVCLRLCEFIRVYVYVCLCLCMFMFMYVCVFMFVCFCLCVLISVIFTWFLLSSYLLKFLVFLYFFWFDLIFIFIYLFICVLKEWEDFRLIYKGFICKVGLGQLNQVNLHLARHEFKGRPTQLNLSPTGVRNQRKFASNPSPIRIRIPAYTSVSIFGITFSSYIQSRWFKLGWKVNLKGYNFVITKSPNYNVKWAKIVG